MRGRCAGAGTKSQLKAFFRKEISFCRCYRVFSSLVVPDPKTVNVTSNIADIAIDNDLYVIAYIPDKYLGKIKYGQKLRVISSVGTVEGEVIYIALNNEYTPKDKQSANDTKHKATKMKVKITDNSGTLKSGMVADIIVPLK